MKFFLLIFKRLFKIYPEILRELSSNTFCCFKCVAIRLKKNQGAKIRLNHSFITV